MLYLDNNATSQPAPEVVAAMREMLENTWGNPSSIHRFGQDARKRVELARAQVAALIGCKERDVIFTSGGTESNNLAIFGTLGHGDLSHGPCLITNRVEHSAVREPAAALAKAGAAVEYLPAPEPGVVQPEHLAEALNKLLGDGRTVLVSVQWVNNETGVIQPVEALAAAIAQGRAMVKARGWRCPILFHVDATQAAGKMPLDVVKAGVDMLTLAAHKFHGPKGVGALYVRRGVRLHPLQLGGPHEMERRAGTENTPGIVGLGVAAELAQRHMADVAEVERLRGLRDRLEQGVLARIPGTIVNSGSAARLWNTTNLAFPNLEAEAILLGLSERGLCAAAGAACSSGSLEPSPVLLAMGIPEPLAHGSVRFSLSRYTTEVEIDEALNIIPTVIAKLRKTLPM